eukprot:4714463-Pyramimonas_sp.AAC.1
MPGNKGILDLFMAKKDVAEAMFKLGNEKGLNNSLLTKMDSWRTSMDNYRNDVGYWDGAAKSYTVNNHWIMALPQSAQKFLKIWEEAVALCEHNDALKQCKISDLTVNEGFLNKKPISDRLESIWEELAEENGGKPSGDEDGNSKLQLAEVDDMEIEDAVMVSKVSRTVALASDSEGWNWSKRVLRMGVVASDFPLLLIPYPFLLLPHPPPPHPAFISPREGIWRRGVKMKWRGMGG